MSHANTVHSPTPHGFRWGPLEVARVCSGDRIGYVLAIKTESQTLEVRVSPAGKHLTTHKKVKP